MIMQIVSSSPDRFKQEFFSAENVKRFVTEHSSKNKKLLLTHFNDILSSLHNSSDDLTQPSIQVKLHERADFRQFIPDKNKRARSASSGAVPMSAAVFEKVINSHNKNTDGNDPHLCAMLVQAALSVRFDNLGDIYEGGAFSRVAKSCDCGPLQTCEPVLKKSCFHKINFNTSKNGKPIAAFLSPKLLPCLERLQSMKNSLNYAKYTRAIKACAGEEYTSHSFRKLIVNLNFIKNRNVGAWSSEGVMINHYLEDCTLVGDFHQFLSSYDFEHKS